MKSKVYFFSRGGCENYSSFMVVATNLLSARKKALEYTDKDEVEMYDVVELPELCYCGNEELPCLVTEYNRPVLYEGKWTL